MLGVFFEVPSTVELDRSRFHCILYNLGTIYYSYRPKNDIFFLFDFLISSSIVYFEMLVVVALV